MRSGPLSQFCLETSRQNQQRCSSPNSHAQLHKQPNEPPGGGNSRAKDDQFGLRPSAVDQNCQTDSVEWQEAAVQTDQLDQRQLILKLRKLFPPEWQQ